MAVQGYTKRNDVLRGGKGWHDLRMVNFYSLYGLMQTVFCSFLTLRAGVVRGYIRLCKAIRSRAEFCVTVKVGMELGWITFACSWSDVAIFLL